MGQCGCERRIEVFVKIQKKNIYLLLIYLFIFFFFWGGGGGGRLGGVGVESSFCENFKKKWGGGGIAGWGFGFGGSGWMLSKNEIFVKIHKRNSGWRSGRSGWGGGWGSGWLRVRVDVNAMLG